jgi:hypothetical protein
MDTATSQEFVDDQVLATVERLAQLDRLPGSDGERAAAEILAAELRSSAGTVRIEEERVHGTYWTPIGLASALAAATAGAGRLFAAIGGALAALLVRDELEIGRRPLRDLFRNRTATNIIAELGPPDPEYTLVVHAHHDAARTGLVFHPAIARLAARTGGNLIERIGGTPAPMWGALAGPLAVTVGAIRGIDRVRRVGAALSAGFGIAMINIAMSPAVPGANDNLSGVAVLLALARSLSDDPPRRLRVLLLSTGSEESFLEAMDRFGARHFDKLPRTGTMFLGLESVGSPELMLLSGEGLLSLQRYPEDLIAVLTRLAAEREIPLHPPFRYRLATDGQIPLRAGYPTAVISSIDWYKAPSNYHWPTDRPENLHLLTVRRATQLALALVRHLEGGLTPPPDRGRPAPSPARTTRSRRRPSPAR